MTRREVLLATLKGLAVGSSVIGINSIVRSRPFRNRVFDLFSLGSLDIPSDTEANKILKEFPREIPGAWDVLNNDIVITPGAKHLLIHVRQIHAHPFRENTPKENEQLAQVQEQIFRILCHLVDTTGLTNVYAEGTSSKTEADADTVMGGIAKASKGISELMDDTAKEVLDVEIDVLERQIQELRENMESPRSYTDVELKMYESIGVEPPSQKTPEEIEKELRGKEADLKEKQEQRSKLGTKKIGYDFSKTSACEAIAAERKNVHLKHGEEKEAHRKAGKNIKEEWFPDKNLILEDREDALLRRIAEEGDTYSATVYGAAHDWRDTIERWNAEPKKAAEKFSFVQITPEFFWY